MTAAQDQSVPIKPLLVPMGDSALLVRFGSTLSEPANRAATAFARSLSHHPLPGVLEVVPNLVSVLLRYDPLSETIARLSGEVRLRLFGDLEAEDGAVAAHVVPVVYGGEEGPDLEVVAEALGMSAVDFVSRHEASTLRVLATGFAPGFVYCGFHGDDLLLPRRSQVRPAVPVGSVLFAAGQTAVTSTTVPTGWHVIGRTSLRNFDPAQNPPTHLRAGDAIRFEAVA